MEIRIDLLPTDKKPVIIMFDEVNWIMYSVEMFDGDPNNLIGVLQDNVFTFLKRDTLSLSDFKFMVYNSDHRDFEVNEYTEYKISE